MKLLFAPMEGITGYVYRNAFMKHYNGIDRFYTPFISPGSSKHFKGKERRDISPENNDMSRVIPQILTNNSTDFVKTVIFLSETGYSEVNLNLGCPSGTVVAKHKGAGFLESPVLLDRFFEETFNLLSQSGCKCSISVKTRIGLEFPSEFEDLLTVYNKYPLSELIIHPRVRNDFYKNKPDLEVFAFALENSTIPVVYNGDINNPADYIKLTERFPSLSAVMIGRGLLANPQLGEQLNSYICGREYTDVLDLNRFMAFHADLIAGYRSEMNCERDVLFRMKELWTYLSRSFAGSDEIVRKINRINALDDYMIFVRNLLG